MQQVLKVDTRFEKARAQIKRAVEEQVIPSIAVAVAKDGKILWEEGFGWADREKMIPATPDTLYSLASITQAFTATGLMRLVEQGSIDLDRPANDYLGVSKLRSFVGDPSEATVRRILSHTSGLTRHWQFFYEDEPYRPPSMDETIARYGILVGQPDGNYEYSNLGYGILDHIISRVAGRSYPDYMRTKVFLPLGLLHTSVGIAPRLESYVAQSYDDEQRPFPSYTSNHVGSCGIYSSAHDLVRFGMFHLKDHLIDQHAILTDRSLDEMQCAMPSSVQSSNENVWGIGLGWATGSNDHGYQYLLHNGGMPGVSTTLKLYPSEDLVVVTLVNRWVNNGRIAQAIVGSILPQYGEALRRDSAKLVAKPEAFALQPEFVGEWVGRLQTWQAKIPFSIMIRTDGDIHVKLGNNLEALLNRPWFNNGTLFGRFAASVSTPDANHYPHEVDLAVWIRDDNLIGSATVMTPTESDPFGLSHYVELTRKTVEK